MKRRKLLGLTGMVLGAVFALVTFSSAMAAEPASVTIDKIKDKKSAVTFPHAAHAAALKGKCGDCHVAAAGGGALKPEFLVKPADMGAAMKHPFHTQCKGCHTTGAKGPTGCTDCHK